MSVCCLLGCGMEEMALTGSVGAASGGGLDCELDCDLTAADSTAGLTATAAVDRGCESTGELTGCGLSGELMSGFELLLGCCCCELYSWLPRSCRKLLSGCCIAMVWGLSRRK